MKDCDILLTWYPHPYPQGHREHKATTCNVKIPFIENIQTPFMHTGLTNDQKDSLHFTAADAIMLSCSNAS